MIKIGLYIYDYLSPKDSPNHLNLNPAKIGQLFPELKKSGLKGGCLYYDAQMLDNRLVMGNLHSARKNGAVILNYTEVTGLYKVNGKASGVYFKNSNKHEGLCKAKAVVNATGAWSNHILEMDPPSHSYGVYPTKGVHLVIPQINPTHALALTTPQDGRVFFLIPWNGCSLLGTTDTPFPFDPDHVTVTEEDKDYLLKAINHYFPDSGLGLHSVLASFAGLRPLVKDHATTASKMDRSHSVHQSSSGLITILGGKYTTYRQMAEEVVDGAIQRIETRGSIAPCSTRQTPLFDPPDRQWMLASDKTLEPLAGEHGISAQQLKHLITNYGSAFWEILRIIKNDPAESQQICKFHPHIYAEVTYVIIHEQAVTLADWFERRTQIAYLPCKGLHCAAQVASKFKALLQWNDDKMHEEIETMMV